MYRNIIRNTTIALGTLLVSSSLVLAGGVQGHVTALDGKGMGTVRSSDGKDHQVKVTPDLKVGSKVDCEMKNKAMECRLGATQSSAVQPTPGTPAAASTAKTSAQPTAPAPTHAVPTPPATMPQTTAPAPAAK